MCVRKDNKKNKTWYYVCLALSMAIALPGCDTEPLQGGSEVSPVIPGLYVRVAVGSYDFTVWSQNGMIDTDDNKTNITITVMAGDVVYVNVLKEKQQFDMFDFWFELLVVNLSNPQITADVLGKDYIRCDFFSKWLTLPAEVTGWVTIGFTDKTDIINHGEIPVPMTLSIRVIPPAGVSKI